MSTRVSWTRQIGKIPQRGIEKLSEGKLSILCSHSQELMGPRQHPNTSSDFPEYRFEYRKGSIPVQEGQGFTSAEGYGSYDTMTPMSSASDVPWPKDHDSSTGGPVGRALTGLSSFSASAHPDEDWTKVTDLVER